MTLDQKTLDAAAHRAVLAKVENQRNSALNEVANLNGEVERLRMALTAQIEQTKQLQESLQNLQASLTDKQGE